LEVGCAVVSAPAKADAQQASVSATPAHRNMFVMN
jgi:hypothetical protein